MTHERTGTSRIERGFLFRVLALMALTLFPLYGAGGTVHPFALRKDMGIRKGAPGNAIVMLREEGDVYFRKDARETFHYVERDALIPLAGAVRMKKGSVARFHFRGVPYRVHAASHDTTVGGNDLAQRILDARFEALPFVGIKQLYFTRSGTLYLPLTLFTLAIAILSLVGYAVLIVVIKRHSPFIAFLMYAGTTFLALTCALYVSYYVLFRIGALFRSDHESLILQNVFTLFVLGFYGIAFFATPVNLLTFHVDEDEEEENDDHPRFDLSLDDQEFFDPSKLTPDEREQLGTSARISAHPANYAYSRPHALPFLSNRTMRKRRSRANRANP